MREYELLRALSHGLSESERRALARVLDEAVADDGPERIRRRPVTVPRRRPAPVAEPVVAYRRRSFAPGEIEALLR